MKTERIAAPTDDLSVLRDRIERVRKVALLAVSKFGITPSFSNVLKRATDCFSFRLWEL